MILRYALGLLVVLSLLTPLVMLPENGDRLMEFYMTLPAVVLATVAATGSAFFIPKDKRNQPKMYLLPTLMAVVILALIGWASVSMT
ncbi:hypothetical protein EUU23_09205 [Sphingorhabdus sp. IMCC26285]|uniref:Uncharacterized protein n=1 Tax=Sphingorhabdus profundilacus TaxID=2509718 RepID=A0A6I4M6X8_9SPHN|nr:hypothetical protein [Sphingorhabdus profundilacus]MVZ97885.1 hypothetical protein [Sphingorhabdus profundilacus]